MTDPLDQEFHRIQRRMKSKKKQRPMATRLLHLESSAQSTGLLAGFKNTVTIFLKSRSINRRALAISKKTHQISH